jgi:hypothetical protein
VKLISTGASARPGIPSKRIEMSKSPSLCVFSISEAARSTKLVWVNVPCPT